MAAPSSALKKFGREYFKRLQHRATAAVKSGNRRILLQLCPPGELMAWSDLRRVWPWSVGSFVCLIIGARCQTC